MIAVDTSALMAILLDEPGAAHVVQALQSADGLCMSAATVAEALIVARRRSLGSEMQALIDGLGFEIDSVSRATAGIVADAYDKFGKGVHPAGLNLGDCFAYAVAKTRDCPLLCVGGDFSRTDLRLAIKT